MKRNFKSLFLCAAVFCFFSCDNPIAPFDAGVINQVKDVDSPSISIITPEQGGTYSSTVEVSGIVSDAGHDGTGGIASVLYEVLDTDIAGDAELDKDGGFSFSFKAESGGLKLSGSISIKITATDWNENVSTFILSLDNTSGAFSYFDVETGNCSAVIKWTAVPMAQTYTIIYTNDGSEPTAENGMQVVVPATTITDSFGIYTFNIDGLENGDLYRFRLMADCNDGERNLSSSGSVIPLSPYYLYPSISNGYCEVALDWLEMTGADSYRVYRSEGRNGTYQDVSGMISQTEYIDRNLTPGAKYYYKIAPSIEGAILSAAAYASPNGMKDVPQILSSVPAPAAPESGDTDWLVEIIAEDDYAFGLLMYNGLVVYDISTPTLPKQIFTERYEEGSLHYYKYGKIQLYDGYLYVSCCSNGLDNGPDTILIYKLDNPEFPLLVNVLQFTNSFVYDFIPNDDYLYIGGKNNNYPDSNTASINVLDISNPEEVDISENLTPNDLEITNLTIEGMTVHNGELYVSGRQYYSGTYLYIYDLEIPTVPAFLGNSSGMSSSECGAVFVEGAAEEEVAYVQGGSKKFQKLDVSDPASISEIANINEISNPMGAAFASGYAYLTYSSGIIQFQGLNGNYDSDSSSFSLAGSRVFASTGNAQDIVYHNGYLLIADGPGGLMLMDSAGFGTVEDSSSELDLYTPNQIAISGDYAYIADGQTGVKILQISGVLTQVGVVDPVLNTNNGIMDVVVQGHYLYAACNATNEEAGVFVYDITEPEKPVPVSGVLSVASNLELYGSYLFVVSLDMVFILDVEDPENPVPIGSLSVEDAKDIKIAGDYAFVYYSTNSPSEAGIVAIDISNPFQPRTAGSCKTGSAFNSATFVLRGDYAFIGKEELYIVDISNPEGLDEGDTGEGLSFWTADHNIYGLDTDGRYLYMSINQSGVGTPQLLQVLDCIDPSSPALVMEKNVGTGKSFCCLNGNTLFIGAESGIVRAFPLNQ